MTKDYQPNQSVLFEEESDQESLPSLAEDEVEEETRPPPNLFPAIFYFLPTVVFVFHTWITELDNEIMGTCPASFIWATKSKNECRRHNLHMPGNG